MQDTERFALILKDRRATLVGRVKAVQADFARGRSGDSEEQAAERENDEALGAIELEARREIDAIDQALNKIESGSFGTCDGCGGPIGPQRLEALPYATHCIDCAQGETHAR